MTVINPLLASSFNLASSSRFGCKGTQTCPDREAVTTQPGLIHKQVAATDGFEAVTKKLAAEFPHTVLGCGGKFTINLAQGAKKPEAFLKRLSEDNPGIIKLSGSQGELSAHYVYKEGDETYHFPIRVIQAKLAAFA